MRPSTRSWAIVLTVIAVLGALAAAWKWTDLAEWAHPDFVAGHLEPLRSRWYGLPVVLVVFVLAELVLFPVLVLVFVCGVVFGPWLGPVYALSGSMASALPPFFLGRHLGRERVERMGGALVKRITASLDRRGVIAIFMLRKVPAPFTIANLVCGASGVSLRDFVLGTLLGMGTGVLLLTVLGAQLMELVRDPRPGAIAGAVALLFAPLLVALVAQRMLNRRMGARERSSDVARDGSSVPAGDESCVVASERSSVVASGQRGDVASDQCGDVASDQRGVVASDPCSAVARDQGSVVARDQGSAS